MKPTLTADQAKALRHIQRCGDDRGMRSKRWERVKCELYRLGYLRRGHGWCWVYKRWEGFPWATIDNSYGGGPR